MDFLPSIGQLFHLLLSTILCAYLVQLFARDVHKSIKQGSTNYLASKVCVRQQDPGRFLALMLLRIGLICLFSFLWIRVAIDTFLQ